MDTTGSSAEYVPEPIITAPGGLALGIVPFVSTGHQLLEQGGVIDPGTLPWRRGLAVGQIVGGLYTAVGGATGPSSAARRPRQALAPSPVCRRPWRQPGSRSAGRPTS